MVRCPYSLTDVLTHYLIDSLTKVTIRMSRHRDPFLFPHLLYHLDPSPLSLLPQPAKAKFHHKFKGLVSLRLQPSQKKLDLP